MVATIQTGDADDNRHGVLALAIRSVGARWLFTRWQCIANLGRETGVDELLHETPGFSVPVILIPSTVVHRIA